MSESDPTHAILDRVEHRPWPLPSTPWIMFQSWQRLLFAHWPIPAARLEPLVPAPLVVEEFDGNGWVGLSPFHLEGLRLRGTPAWLVPPSDFPEMNLRTYVRVGGRPGIFFFSLDAGSRLAVKAARLLYRLPYEGAEMEIRRSDGWIHYRSRRREGPEAEFVGRYRPTSSPFRAPAGTLEHFLTERYALYTVLRNGRVLRGDIHHGPWRLCEAEAEIERNTVPGAHGISLPDTDPILHYSERQDTLIWPPARMEV